MAHHSSDFPFQDGEFLKGFFGKKDETNPMDLGPTGKFPEGKIADNDEGEIKIAITSLKGKIVIDFGKPIRTIGFTKDQAVQIANSLFERARQL